MTVKTCFAALLALILTFIPIVESASYLERNEHDFRWIECPHWFLWLCDAEKDNITERR